MRWPPGRWPRRSTERESPPLPGRVVVVLGWVVVVADPGTWRMWKFQAAPPERQPRVPAMRVRADLAASGHVE